MMMNNRRLSCISSFEDLQKQKRHLRLQAEEIEEEIEESLSGVREAVNMLAGFGQMIGKKGSFFSIGMTAMPLVASFFRRKKKTSC